MRLAKRNFTTGKRANVSNDLLTSASMGYAGKKVPKTHSEHLQALVKLNLFDDTRIEMSLNKFNKTDFCTKKPYERAEDEVEFNPFSLDPQVIGHGQVLTSSVMHATTMAKLQPIFSERKGMDQLSLLDVGCGTGYSTLLYADLASQIVQGPFQMLGTDINAAFIEHCLLQKEKYPVDKCNLQFMEHDFLKGPIGVHASLWDTQFDVCTFGFEVSLDLLRAKQTNFKKNAHLIVPLSREDFDREQDFKVLQYKGEGQFDVVENIMRTSFAPRIDTERMTEASLDIDYFNNMQRHSKLQLLEERVVKLEADFKLMTQGGQVKLNELMKDPSTKALLEELRQTKKRVQNLRYAMEDSIAEAKAEEEKLKADRAE